MIFPRTYYIGDGVLDYICQVRVTVEARELCWRLGGVVKLKTHELRHLALGQVIAAIACIVPRACACVAEAEVTVEVQIEAGIEIEVEIRRGGGRGARPRQAPALRRGRVRGGGAPAGRAALHPGRHLALRAQPEHLVVH